MLDTDPPLPTFSATELQDDSSDPMFEWLKLPFSAMCFAHDLA